MGIHTSESNYSMAKVDVGGIENGQAVTGKGYRYYRRIKRFW